MAMGPQWVADYGSELFQTHCPLASHQSLTTYLESIINLNLIQIAIAKMSQPIPPDLRTVLLPSPELSVSEFLKFPLPPQVQTHTPDISLYWSKAEPNVKVIKLQDLKDHPIPLPIFLSELMKQTNLLESSNSICYSHLPPSWHSHFPLWVLTYWVEVSQLWQHVRQPWASAELYLVIQQKCWKLPNIWQLCDTAQTALLSLPWAGNVCGFEKAEPRMKLTTYLSQKWLVTSHIDQQLDLLWMDVEWSGQPTCKIVQQSFFWKIVELYRGHETKPSNEQTSGAWYWRCSKSPAYSSGWDSDGMMILTMYMQSGYWLCSHVTMGVGAQTPYSICPPPKKAMSSLPQKKGMQTISRNNISKRILWVIKKA